LKKRIISTKFKESESKRKTDETHLTALKEYKKLTGAKKPNSNPNRFTEGSLVAAHFVAMDALK
jgi:hypothetical protein